MGRTSRVQRITDLDVAKRWFVRSRRLEAKACLAEIVSKDGSFLGMILLEEAPANDGNIKPLVSGVAIFRPHVAGMN